MQVPRWDSGVRSQAALRTVSAPPDVQFMPRKRYCDVGTSCRSPTSAMFWLSVLAGQLPLRSFPRRAVRGGTVLDHGLGILASRNIVFH